MSFTLYLGYFNTQNTMLVTVFATDGSTGHALTHDLWPGVMDPIHSTIQSHSCTDDL